MTILNSKALYNIRKTYSSLNQTCFDFVKYYKPQFFSSLNFSLFSTKVGSISFDFFVNLEDR